ncbi:hypothetical protein CHLNCDRAFT_141726 [Chlorella variabilis]|uniref:Peptidase S1 domain-containing protein n=1 Tax=Chlorella variabilis TaxID=554065 RepID=E1ZTG8_CHLVA|nr:hypothetical protein CHLNCDRAFT_141726 [Chlorella variabilis]EFN50899.1 hypothetical protein CHLNCDRAFT_141726 [Chlorella variabilis]|eukprot:XP_005843001.1 hypothetical protein CHLNCDRAFT_141726 [Chlorella variabilis]
MVTFSLPAGALTPPPSALLNAPPTNGWTAVPGAHSLSNSTDADEDAVDQAARIETRVIQGDPDPRNELFPYAAYLQLEAGEYVATCSGSLVAPDWVVSAAHCLMHEGTQADPGQLGVWIKGRWHNVAAVFVHQGFDDNQPPFSRPGYDIGMLKLSQASDAPTVALPAASGPPLPAPGDTVYAAGFGLDDTGLNSEVLRYTDLTAFDSGTCPQSFLDNFCAGGVTGFTCQGDSGGPIVLPTATGDVLVGLTSWGSLDCTVPYAYYTRLTDYVDQMNIWMSSGNAGSSNSNVGTLNINQLASAVQAWMGQQLGGGNR